jgi:DNA-binding LytR/AlgR family response regulator
VLFFRTPGGEPHAHLAHEVLRLDLALAQFQERLPQPPFFLARRGVLVNLERLREIQPYHRGAYVLLVDDTARTEIQVSERQSKELRLLLEGGSFP